MKSQLSTVVSALTVLSVFFCATVVTADAPPLALVVKGQSPGWEPLELQEGLAAHLKRKVIMASEPEAPQAAGTIVVSVSSQQQALVSYYPRGGTARVRKVQLPADPEGVLATLIGTIKEFIIEFPLPSAEELAAQQASAVEAERNGHWLMVPEDLFVGGAVGFAAQLEEDIVLPQVQLELGVKSHQWSLGLGYAYEWVADENVQVQQQTREAGTLDEAAARYSRHAINIFAERRFGFDGWSVAFGAAAGVAYQRWDIDYREDGFETDRDEAVLPFTKAYVHVPIEVAEGLSIRPRLELSVLPVATRGDIEPRQVDIIDAPIGRTELMLGVGLRWQP